MIVFEFYQNRSIARIAKEYDAYVVTKDSELFVFAVKGVIFSYDLLNEHIAYYKGYLALEDAPKNCLVFVLDNILSFLGMSYNQYLCATFLTGNNYIKNLFPDRRGDILNSIRYIRSCSCFEDSKSLLNINKKGSSHLS